MTVEGNLQPRGAYRMRKCLSIRFRRFVHVVKLEASVGAVICVSARTAHI